MMSRATSAGVVFILIFGVRAVLAQTDGMGSTGPLPDTPHSTSTSASFPVSIMGSTTLPEEPMRDIPAGSTTVPERSNINNKAIPSDSTTDRIETTPSITTTIVTEGNPTGSTKKNSLALLMITTGLILGGYAAWKTGSGAAGQNQKVKEENNEGPRCGNIKDLLDKKLEELTDLKSKLKDTGEEKIRDAIRETLDGTSAGEIVAKIERAEKEYERFKKLYEECVLDASGTRRMLIIGPSLSGKTTLVRHLRKEAGLPVEEMDERLVAANNGIYPTDTEYRKKVLRPKIVKEVLERKNTVFFTNADYFSTEDLKTARDKGFTITQLVLPPEVIRTRNMKRMQEEGYDDQSVWIEDMLAYQENIKNFVDQSVDANQPLEKIIRDLGI